MEYRISKFKALKYLGLTAVMVGASFACTRMSDLEAHVIGWIGVAFFGLGFIVFPIQFLKSGSQLTIDSEGILDGRKRGWGRIPWSEITRVYLGEIRSQKFLCVEVKDEKALLARSSGLGGRLAQFNRDFGFPPVSIGLSQLDQAPEEILSHIESLRKDSELR